MKKTLWGWLLTLCGMLCVMGFAPDSTPPDLSSPKATVRSFVEALGRHDIKGMAMCVAGNTDTAILEKVLGSELTSFPKLEAKNLTAETEGNTTRVAVEITVVLPAEEEQRNRNGKISFVDMFTLEKQGEVWHILPDPETLQLVIQQEEKGASTSSGLRPLTTFVAMIAAPKPTLEVWQTTNCLSHTKQIALGVMMYVQDYDEMLPLKKGSQIEMINPYIRNRDVFTCPIDMKGTISYTFNPNILQVPMAKVIAPAKTVMLYEGKNKQLDFRHEGKAAVAFLDGHAAMIGPDEAKSLFWYAEGANPKPPAPPTTTKKPAVKSSRKKR